MEKKMKINKTTFYEPTILDSTCEWRGKPKESDGSYLFISDYAKNKIHNSLNWGQNTEQNKVEQGGILLGKIYKHSNEIYSSVEDIILANTSGNSTYVEFTPDAWTEMYKQLGEINLNRSKDEQLVVIGWFHTHPNNLSVFMSNTDMNTQKSFFSEEWQSSLVMNPHSQTSRAFFGNKAKEGNIVFRDFKSVLKEQNRNSISKDTIINQNTTHQGVEHQSKISQHNSLLITKVIASADRKLNNALKDSLAKIEEAGKKIEEIFETDLGLEEDSDEILLAQVAEIEKQQDIVKKEFSKKVDNIVKLCEIQKDEIEEFSKLSDEEVKTEISTREKELKDIEKTLNASQKGNNENSNDISQNIKLSSRRSELKFEIEALNLSRDKNKGIQSLQKYIDHLKSIKDKPLEKIGKDTPPKVDFVQSATNRIPIEEHYYDSNITKRYYATPQPAKTIGKQTVSNSTNVRNNTQQNTQQNVSAQSNTAEYKSLESILEEIDNNSNYSEMQKKVLKAKKIKFYEREKQKWEQEQGKKQEKAKTPHQKFVDSCKANVSNNPQKSKSNIPDKEKRTKNKSNKGNKRNKDGNYR